MLRMAPSVAPAKQPFHCWTQVRIPRESGSPTFCSDAHSRYDTVAFEEAVDQLWYQFSRVVKVPLSCAGRGPNSTW